MAADKPIKVGRWREAKGASEALNHLQCGLCVRTEGDARRGRAAVRDVDEQSSSTDGLREQRKVHVYNDSSWGGWRSTCVFGRTRDDPVEGRFRLGADLGASTTQVEFIVTVNGVV